MWIGTLLILILNFHTPPKQALIQVLLVNDPKVGEEPQKDIGSDKNTAGKALQLVAVLKVWLRIYPFSDKTIENACNFMDSCLIYIKINAPQSLCKYEGDCIFKICW